MLQTLKHFYTINIINIKKKKLIRTSFKANDKNKYLCYKNKIFHEQLILSS